MLGCVSECVSVRNLAVRDDGGGGVCECVCEKQRDTDTLFLLSGSRQTIHSQFPVHLLSRCTLILSL